MICVNALITVVYLQLKYPKQVFIILVEYFCERFTFLEVTSKGVVSPVGKLVVAVLLCCRYPSVIFDSDPEMEGRECSFSIPSVHQFGSRDPDIWGDPG